MRKTCRFDANFERQKKGVALSLLNLSWVLLNNFIDALWKRKLGIKYHILIRSTFGGSKTGKARSKTGKKCSKTGKDVLQQEKDVLKQEKMF